MAWIEKRYRTENGIKTKEKLYFVVDRVNGKRISRPAGASLATAGDIKRQMEDESVRIKNGLPLPAKDVTIAEARAIFEKEVNSRDGSKLTWPTYERAILKLEERFPGKMVGSINKEDMRILFAELRARYEINGAIGTIGHIRTFLTFCVDQNFAVLNPATKITKGYKKKKVARFLTDQEAQFILSCIDSPIHFKRFRKDYGDIRDDFKAIVKTVFETGMREGDIANFKRSWIEDRFVYVIGGKGDKSRTIPLNNDALAVLAPYIAKKTEYIFPGWTEPRICRRWIRFYKRCKKIMPALPKRCRFHDLRHTFAKNFLADTGDFKALQLILGHSSSTLTMDIYGHLETRHLADRMANLKSRFREAPQMMVIS